MTFEQFARARTQALLRTATAICLDRHLAEDLVQDVLIKLHKRWDRVSDVDNLDAYVRRMLVNEHLSWRRKWARLIPRAEPLDADTRDDQNALSAFWQRSSFRDTLSGLPNRQRAVLALRYQADLDDNEIAAVLGCSPGTVRGYASRALATLRARSATSELGRALTEVEGR